MSRSPIALAVAAFAVLILVWALWPHDEASEVARQSPPRLASAAKDRALPRPLRRARPDAPRLPERPGGDGAHDTDDSAAAAEATPATTPAPGERDAAALAGSRLSRSERSLSRRALATARAGRAATPRAGSGAAENLEDEEAQVEDSGINGPPPNQIPTFPPESPFANLTEAELLDYIVAMRRVRDSGALRRVQPDDYWRIMEIEPDSRGLKDADRIMRQIFGMGIGEWLAKTRGPQNFSLE